MVLYGTERGMNSSFTLFTSPLMRQYWAAAERGRTSLEPGSPEQLFAKKLDDLCRDYETAVAAARRRPQSAAASRESRQVGEETAA
jgi:hypothetical protein